MHTLWSFLIFSGFVGYIREVLSQNNIAMKNKKMKIQELKVKSFIIDDTKLNVETIKGGYITFYCTAGWTGCPDDGGGGGGGTYNSCNPNPWYTHRPCVTGEPAHCNPCK